MNNLAIFTMLVFTGCNNNHNFKNPEDPHNKVSAIAAATTSSSTSSGTAAEGTTGSGTASSGTTSGGTTASSPAKGACLTDTCTAAAEVPLLALKSVQIIGEGCPIADVRILKNESSNQFTVVYRANYASAGLWQLYARNVTVSSDGTMALQGNSQVNLFPSVCLGNTLGVTAYNITGYRSGSSTSKVFNYTNASNTTDFSVDMTCYNTALNSTNTFNTSALSPSVNSTTTFLSTDGAVGYNKYLNVYVKANGTTVNPNGSASTSVVPGNWTSSGTNPLGSITSIYGNDASGGMYFMTDLSPFRYYLSSTGAVSGLPSGLLDYWPTLPLFAQGRGGLYHSTLGYALFVHLWAVA